MADAAHHSSTALHADDGNVVMVVSLPAEIAGRLRALADAVGDDPADIVTDAIELHLDRCEAIRPCSTNLLPSVTVPA